MSKVHVKTGDTVVILSGKDRGKKGKIMACLLYTSDAADDS